MLIVKKTNKTVKMTKIFNKVVDIVVMKVYNRVRSCRNDKNIGGKNMKITKKREWLEKLRKEAGLTQEEVADKSGIHTASYSNIENGKKTLSVKTAKKIAEVLNFDWKDFFL